MKHIRRFVENKETLRKEMEDEISSSFFTKGNLEEDAEEIKNEILTLVDDLLESDYDILEQLSKIKKGEISQKDVDMIKIMEFSQKFNQLLMDIIKKYKK